MKALISLFLLVLPYPVFAQSCPSDMTGISTTDHPVLRVGGRDALGHRINGVGDPNTDVRNWQNGIYNLFMQDGGSANYYYDTVIYNQTGPFVTSNDDEHEIGACNENGQCVQARFQVSYNTVYLPAYIRRLFGSRGAFFPTAFQTRPSAVNISYTSPNGAQHNMTINAVNGVIPPSQPVVDRQPPNPDCLTNEDQIVRDNDDEEDQESEDEEENYNDDDEYEWPEIEDDGDCSACEAFFDGDENGELEEDPYEWIEEEREL